jgi:hypothetical protein
MVENLVMEVMVLPQILVNVLENAPLMKYHGVQYGVQLTDVPQLVVITLIEVVDVRKIQHGALVVMKFGNVRGNAVLME